MIDATRSATTPRAACARLRAPLARRRPAGAARPGRRSWPRCGARCPASCRRVRGCAAPAAAARRASAGAARAAAGVLGLRPADVRLGARDLRRAGLRPVMGAAPAAAAARALPDLAPGGAIGISLVEGDLDMSVTGTITHIDQGRVYAFGHPFYNLGPTQFPMKKAYVYSVFPSLYQSWKISAAGEAGGHHGPGPHDRHRRPPGPRAAHDPGRGGARTSRGEERKLLVPHRRGRAVQPRARLRVRGLGAAGQRARLRHLDHPREAQLTLSGGREVRVDDLFAEEQPALQAAALVAAPARRTSCRTTSSASRSRSWTSRSRRSRPSRPRCCSAPGSSAPGPCGPARRCRSRSAAHATAARRVRDDPDR